jgi:VIT1/CCC1 family predicted Fe2+/Mn2+ transporter
MNLSVKKGVSFGLTSGIITTLGLIIGLDAGTGSKSVVLAGILVIAIADALSDSFGMHLSEESDKSRTTKQVWTATISTFFAKFFFALTFVIPILLFSLQTAIILSVFWGILLISGLSYFIAKSEHHSPKKAIFEHLLITVSVIILAELVGRLVALI